MAKFIIRSTRELSLHDVVLEVAVCERDETTRAETVVCVCSNEFTGLRVVAALNLMDYEVSKVGRLP